MISILLNMKYAICRRLSTRLNAIKYVERHKTAKIVGGSQVVRSKLGRYTYITGSIVIDTEVGSFCSIADGCIIGGGAHPTNWISTSPIFYSGRNIFHENFSRNKFSEYEHTTIGNDVWIGSCSLLKAGISIGDGAIVGMGSVVTNDIPPYEIWAGNPARLIRSRFNSETRDQLLTIKWWEWSIDQIHKKSAYMNNVDSFLEACCKENKCTSERKEQL